MASGRNDYRQRFRYYFYRNDYRLHYTLNKDSNKGTLTFSGDLIFKDLTSKAAIRGNDSSNVSDIIADGDISFTNVSTREQIASMQAVSLIGKNITAESVHQTGSDMMGTAFWVHKGVLQATGEDSEGGLISVKNSDFEHGSYGSAALWADNAGQILADKIEVDNVQFASATGRDKTNYVASGIHAENGSHVVADSSISIRNIEASTIQAAGLHLEGTGDVGGLTPPGSDPVESDPATLLKSTSITINNIEAKTEGLNAFGIYAIGDDEESEGLKLSADELGIDKVSGTFAYGFAQMLEANSQFGSAEIANISAATEAAGVYLRGLNGSSSIKFGSLNIHDVKVDESGFSSLVDAGVGEISADNARLLTDNVIAYHGAYSGEASGKVKVHSTAIRAVAGGNINFSSASGDYTIVGDMVAGYGSSEIVAENAGKIDISGSKVNIYGDVYAGNGGQINLNLTGANSVIEGQIDDYHELAESSEVFHNAAFRDDTGNELAVSKAGTVNLTLDGATWTARGQSFVDTVNLSNGAVVDLSKNENSSVTVKNLSGSGVFKMHLNSADHSQSDMLYVTGNFSGNHELIIEGDAFNANDITADNPLRFATVKGQVSGAEFKARSIGGGFFNNEHEILTQSFEDGAADNEDYNGTSEDIDYKPGNDYIESAFADEDTNLLLGSAVKQEQSNVGRTIISMSKANYANAVYMDTLNKRQDEARYSMGRDNGVWVRMRHDNIGKEDAFRSHNTMFEMGYDVKDANSYGEFHTGVALDYLNGSIDYHNVNGDGDLQRYGLWFYTTFLGNEGQYADLVLKYGHLKNDFDVTSELDEKISGNYSNDVVSLSAETGWKFTHDTGFYIEPQLQLQYSYVTSADYSTSQHTQVELDSIHSLIGRAGFRAGKDFATENPITAYIRGDVLHEFLGDQDIRAHDNTGVFDATYENDDTWYSAGVGLSVMTSQNTYFYIEGEQVFGADNDNTYTVSGGFKHSF